MVCTPVTKLDRICFARSNCRMQLLEFRSTNYSDHVLYLFFYYILVLHSGHAEPACMHAAAAAAAAACMLDEPACMNRHA